MLLVAAFIEKMVIRMTVEDDRIKALTLKHCIQLHGVSLNSALFITFVGDIGILKSLVAPSLHYETIILWLNICKFSQDRCRIK